MSSDPVTIAVKAKGPLLVRGTVTILDEYGLPLEPPPAKTPGILKLCRCGATATSPFCDGSHRRQPG